MIYASAGESSCNYVCLVKGSGRVRKCVLRGCEVVIDGKYGLVLSPQQPLGLKRLSNN